MRTRLRDLLRGALAPWLAGLATVALFLCLCASRQPAQATDRLSCTLILPDKLSEAGEPIAVTGHAGFANFLALRRVGPDRMVFSFDAWGSGGPSSEPLPCAPGRSGQLRLRLPGILEACEGGGGLDGQGRGLLEVSWEGRTVLSARVHCHQTPVESLQLGTNTAGGTSCGPRFSGKLLSADGAELAGSRPLVLRAGGGFGALLKAFPLYPAYAPLLLLALAGCYAAAFRGFAAPGLVPSAALRRHRVFVAAWLASAAVFLWLVSGGDFRLIHPDIFGTIYDHQALSLLRGRLDIPRDVASGEAFLYQGNAYTYFGPVPALLRMPFVMLGVGWEQLTRLFLLAYYLASLALAYLLLLGFWRASRGGTGADTTWGQGSGRVKDGTTAEERKDTPPAWLTLVFLANVAFGSSLLYLGSRAYVYHEAILGGIAWALAAAWATLAYQRTGRRRLLALAVAFGLAALQTRPTAGLFALALPAAAALAEALARWRCGRGLHWGVPAAAVAACFAASLTFPALSYLKFRSFDGAPFKYHVQYDTARLARFDGRNFHLSNLACNTEAYFLAPNLEWHPSFPFLYDKAQDLARHPAARMDMTEPMAGIPYVMPGLCLLAVCAAIGLASGSFRPRILAAPPLVASVPLALALLTAVALSHRYSGDFCPPLIVFAALGCASLADGWRDRLRVPLGAVTAAAILLTLGLSLQFQGEQTWGSPPAARSRFEALRASVDGFFGLPPPPWTAPRK